MKKFTLQFMMGLICHSAIGQVVTSISDGDWYDPATWDCDCVPGNGADIVVEHHVFLEDWIVVNNGSLTVMENGYLDGWAIGYIYLDCEAQVFGVIECVGLQVDNGTSDPFVNHGYVSCDYIINDRDQFHNAGYLDVVDTIALNADITNEAAGEFWCYSIGGPGTFTNHGNASISPNGVVERLINTDTLEVMASSASHIKFLSNTAYVEVWGGVVDSLLNNGFMEAATIHIARRYEGNGGVWVMPVGQDFIIDSTAHATISSPGVMLVSDGDLRVFGLLDGDGRVCVDQVTLNNGAIAGTIDICDQSPTALEWPFLDVNNGTVEATVTFCAGVSCTIAVPEAAAGPTVRFFPVPASGWINVQGASTGDRLVFEDLSGRPVLTRTLTDPAAPISLSGLAPGCYIASVTRSGARMAVKVIID